MKRISVILTAMLISLVMGGSWSWAGEQECSTEITGWVLESPGKDWTLVDERTVTDKEAWDEEVVISEAIPAQHYSLKGNSGIEKDEVPVFPADYWQANTKKEPHYQGNATPASNVDGSDYVDGQSGLHYTSNESNGKRDWFYFQAAVPAEIEIVHHEAVTHEEFKFEKTTCVDKPDEPKTDNPDKPDKPDNPDEPKDEPKSPEKASKTPDELPHTGGNLALAGIAGALLAAGSGLVWFGRRRLTDV